MSTLFVCLLLIFNASSQYCCRCKQHLDHFGNRACKAKVFYDAYNFQAQTCTYFTTVKMSLDSNANSNKESIKKMSEDVECNIQIEKEYQLTEENIKTQEAESSTTSETEKLQVKEDDPPKQDKDGMDCEETSLEDPVKYTEKDFCTDSENSGSEDNENTGASLKKNKDTEPAAKKYKQTTLDSMGAVSGKKTKKEKEVKKWNLRKRHSDKDTEEYRKGYPGKKDDPKLKDNLKFYTGEIQSTPEGAFIDEIHTDWWGDYKLLERHHGYIQWIFPIRAEGMNWQAQPLQLHEAEGIKNDPKAMARVMKSYEMMLDFYGMKLKDPTTGVVERSKNWQECFHNLSWSSHNYLRITRILKSLGELGLEHLKKPLLEFVLHEAVVKGTLKRTLNSCRDYWVGTLMCEADREELYEFIEEHS